MGAKRAFSELYNPGGQICTKNVKVQICEHLQNRFEQRKSAEQI